MASTCPGGRSDGRPKEKEPSRQIDRPRPNVRKFPVCQIGLPEVIHSQYEKQPERPDRRYHPERSVKTREAQRSPVEQALLFPGPAPVVEPGRNEMINRPVWHPRYQNGSSQKNSRRRTKRPPEPHSNQHGKDRTADDEPVHPRGANRWAVIRIVFQWLIRRNREKRTDVFLHLVEQKIQGAPPSAPKPNNFVEIPKPIFSLRANTCFTRRRYTL